MRTESSVSSLALLRLRSFSVTLIFAKMLGMDMDTNMEQINVA